MLHYRPHRRLGASPPRRRMLALILGAGGLSVVLAAGLVLSAAHLMHSPRSTSGTSSSTPAATTREGGVSAALARARDELAQRAMPDTGTGHEFGWPQLSTRDPGTAITLPRPRGVDALGVAQGFPQTPVGALAQLAAIDTAALESGSLPGVRAVITAWAAPGGPTARSWSGVTVMASLLEDFGLSGAGSPTLRIGVRPAMGLIKGQVGDDFVVACVDLSLDIRLATATTAVSADCQRMLWQDGRWVIGPGSEPAAPTQVWPGTDAAIDAGFRDLEQL